jgi:hypothetical protein
MKNGLFSWNGPREVQKDVYVVKIDGMLGKKEKAVKIAINEFVRSKGHESYDMELTQKPGFMRKYYSYTVTMPGSIPVEDLSKSKVVDEKGTGTLIAIPLGIAVCAVVIVPIVLVFVAIGDAAQGGLNFSR